MRISLPGACWGDMFFVWRAGPASHAGDRALKFVDELFLDLFFEH